MVNLICNDQRRSRQTSVVDSDNNLHNKLDFFLINILCKDVVIGYLGVSYYFLK